MAFGVPLSEVLGKGFGIVAGKIILTSGTATLQTIAAPTMFSGDVSLNKLGTGRYQINVTPFRGPNSVVIPLCVAGSSNTAALGTGVHPGLSAVASLVSFSSGTAPDLCSFVIGVTSASTYTDCDVHFIAFSF